jgi:hypothetical protein
VTRQNKIAHDPADIEGLLVPVFLKVHQAPPEDVIFDIDGTARKVGWLLQLLPLFAAVRVLRAAMPNAPRHI